MTTTPLNSALNSAKIAIRYGPENSGDQRHLEIRYQQNLKIIYVRGWSVQNGLDQAYDQLLILIDEHFSKSDELCIFFRYNLFNSSTAKYLLNTIKVLNKYHENGKVPEVYWSCLFAPEDMMETGEDLREFCEFDFFINKN